MFFAFFILILLWVYCAVFHRPTNVCDIWLIEFRVDRLSSSMLDFKDFQKCKTVSLFLQNVALFLKVVTFH